MIIDQIHQHFPNLYDLRAREIRVDKQLRKVFCTLSYPNVTTLNVSVRGQIAEFIKTLIPQGYLCAITYVNDHFNDLSFRRLMNDVFKSKFPLFAGLAKSNMSLTVKEKSVDVEFRVNTVMNRNIETADICGQLDAFFKNYTS